MKSKTPKPFTTAQTQKIVKLHKKGLTQREIAKRLRRSRSGIWGVLRRAGRV